jgi:glyoxylase-like metal-dependent hydrolase (beta-lactamase superfamily II)
MSIKQLSIGYDNFCYILTDPREKIAAVIDPGYSAKKIFTFLQENNYNLKYIVATHYHNDHTNAISELKTRYPESQILCSDIENKYMHPKADITISNDSKVLLGSVKLHFILTPGHTPGGICILVDNTALITGDTLFIDDCGRTDLPGGNLKDMYNSLQNKIKPLADDIIVYPGHNYGQKPFDSLGNQKKTNKTLAVNSFEEFSKIE